MRDGLWGVGVLALVVVGAGWSPAWAQEWVAGEADRLGEVVVQAPGRAAALGAARQLGEHREYMPVADYLERLQGLIEEVDDPLVEHELSRQRAWARMEAGVGEGHLENGRFARAQGCLVDWQLLGPFENSSMQGFEARFGPEDGESGPYEGRMGEVNWRGLGGEHLLCSYQLNGMVYPSTSAVVYLAAQVEVEEGFRGQLLVGSRSAYRVWVNGEPVGERAGEFGLAVDGEGWPVELVGGRNEVLVKLASTGQGGLGWTARLVDEDGRPVEGVEIRGVEPEEVVEGFEGFSGEVLGGALARVWAGWSAEQPRLEQLYGAYLLSKIHKDDADQPWRGVAERLEGQVEGLSAQELVLLSGLFDEYWKGQQLLGWAVDREEAGLFERYWRAKELSKGQTLLEWEAARGELEAIVEESPGFLSARIELARWYERHEGWPRALGVLKGWDFAEREEIPAWVKATAELEERAGEAAEAARLRERAARFYQVSGSFGWRLMQGAMARGELDEALELVRGYGERAPWSRTWALLEAQILRAAGDDEGALEVLDGLIQAYPQDRALKERRAEMALVMGDEAQAVEFLEEALALRPMASHLREYLEHLQPQVDRFYEPWVVEGLREIGAEAVEGPNNYDLIVDQTVHHVARNGLGRRFVQRAQRVLRDEGISGARSLRVGYQSGDERVEVLGVRVLKADGTVGEDYRRWSSGGSRKRTTTYNDYLYVNLQANDVEVGDIVEFRYVVHQVANENFRGDYFGDMTYLQHPRPVAMSRYAVIYPADWELYFREPRLEHMRFEDALPGGEALGDGERLTAFELWQVPRVYTDSDQPGYTEVYDHILVSNMAKYDEVGRWWWNLIEEQLVVDDVIRQEVARLVAGKQDEASKVEAIYNFVAQNTRYLHLGLGIHGWKPYRTSTVIRNRYGDCKDKAALLKVMLEEAGVEAQMVLVRTRHLGPVESEPASMHVFNHAVTYVPSLDLFLDATAEFNGPYELTSMDQGAQALVIDDGGATKWVEMPIDEAHENLLRQELEVDLRGEVPLVRGRLLARGARAVSYRRSLEDGERRDEVFERSLASTFAGLKLLSAEYEGLDDRLSPTTIRYEAEAPGLLRGGDEGRSLYPMGARRDILGAYARESTRHQDRMFRVPFANEVHLRYRLPQGLSLERMPDSQRVESEFGEFRVDYRRQGEELVVDVGYSVAVQRVSVADYEEFRSFVAQMQGALNETIRLIGEEVSR